MATPDLVERIIREAERFDMPNSTFVCAIIDGAMRTGKVMQLIEASSLSNSKRRFIRSYKWERIKPNEWHAAVDGVTYKMIKKGSLKNSKSGEPWTLTTPHGSYSLVPNRSESQRESNKIIAAEKRPDE